MIFFEIRGTHIQKDGACRQKASVAMADLSVRIFQGAKYSGATFDEVFH